MNEPIDDAAVSAGLALVGKVISGRYQIEALLGEGGMGAVYLAEHTYMRKRVAVKVLHAGMMDNAELAARFEREAMAAAHIEHPNVVAATDFGRMEDGAFFLVLEYVEGVSLRSAIEQGPMPPARALAIARQIAMGLGRAHELGIVHRDLKPENVMLTDRERAPDFVKVLDFGIAKVPLDAAARARGAEALTRMGSVFGTPEYMSPEQAVGESVDARSDLYALGVILYEMVAGVRPFEGGDMMDVLRQHLLATPPAIADRAPSVVVPASIEALALRLLSKAPADRCASAAEVLDAIDAAASDAGIPTAQPSRRDAIASAPAIGAIGSSPTMLAGLEEPAVSSRWLATKQPAGPSSLLARSNAVIARLSAAARAIPLPPARYGLPRVAWLALPAIAFAGVGVLLLFFATRRRHDDASATDAGTKSSPIAALFDTKHASADDFESARLAGASALEQLARSYPEDVRIPRELVSVYTLAGRSADAMRTLGVVARLEPAVAAEPAMDAAVYAAASGDAASAETVIEVLEGDLGAHGVDLLYELSNRAGPNKKAFARALADPTVRAHASPPAAVLLDLKGATTCTAKRDVIERASVVGDARAVVLIKPLVRRGGCGIFGSRDCWGCLRADSTAENAIAAIEARASDGAP
ncbi:MAG: serine/threonine protein kinase [Myxococcaceae bacterium]|nr:serine/threonine protein kinase [Myxococcaceae bacterium]